MTEIPMHKTMDYKRELKERAKELDCLYRLTPLFTSYIGEEAPLLRKVEIELMKAMTEPSKTQITLMINSAIKQTPDFCTSLKLDDEETLVLSLFFTETEMILVPREKGLLESVLKLTAGSIQRLRNESAIKRKNTALGEMLIILEEERKKDTGQLQLKMRTLVFPLLRQIDSLLPDDNKQLILLKNELDKISDNSNKVFSTLSGILTPREIEIAALISDGMPSKEIADILNISIETVERHRCTIRKKLGINRTDINLRSFLTTL
jgi:DNA-binding CsgD family transcriptional regulator